MTTIPQNEKVLDFGADLITRGEGDIVFKKWIELCFYIAYIDNEVKHMLRASIQSEKAFIYLDKYIVLIIRESIENIPKLYSNFLKTLNEVESKDGQKRFDRQKLDEGYQAFKAAIKTIKDDGNFMQDLIKLRNSVAAHHFDKQGSIHPLVDWYMIKRKQMDSQPEASTLLYYAAIVAGTLYPLARSLNDAILTKD